MMNVPLVRHAETEAVSILALMIILAVPMLSALFQITMLFANVLQE